MYQSLYRQYRPKTFDEILGQDHITTILKNQIKNNNLAHAYLFSGTKGTGKTSAAKIFSRAANCLDPMEGNPCNKCEICLGISNETIMDVIEMDAASNRRIENIRDLKEKVIYPPSRTKYRIYIMDEVHMLTPEAFNALLKTLEEPPKHLIFILATTEMEKLPPTILSRCQRFEFKRITIDDMLINMKSILKDLNLQAEERGLELIARSSDGAMRDALSLLDQCIAYGKDNLTYDDILDILGIANLDSIFSLVDSLIDKNVEGTLNKIDEIIQSGKNIHQFLKDIIGHFRNLLIIITSTKNSHVLDLDEKAIDKYIDQSKKIDLNYILEALDLLGQSEEKIKRSTQARIILEMALIKIINLSNLFNLEKRVKHLEEQISGAIRVEETTKPKKQTFIEEIVKEKPSQDLTLEIINKEWYKVLDTIKSKKVSLEALLKEGKTISYKNGRLVIGYDRKYDFHKNAIGRPENQSFVEEEISKHFNSKIEVNFIISDENIVEKKNEKKNEEIIKELKDFFGEDLLEIK